MNNNTALKAQQKQQHRHQQQQYQAMAFGVRGPTSTVRHQMLGSKDLIIRMLAEVFQVNQTNDGQVKWLQVSTSLVPVSLYSRTTNKWLNYLLAVSSTAATNTASGMSPDSRDFLLLLQQFYQQQNRSSLLAENGIKMDEQNLVVFQVVAHDYIDAQCKKILNVKIIQPGTRLGQASDYFVYWKEQPCNHQHHHHHHQHRQVPTLQSSSSFASNTSLGRQLALNGRQLSGLSPLNTTSATCCQMESQTWGLNFASINDAKLFYDICSLNLVDLDFNSDYLKHLALSDRNTSVCRQNQFAPSSSLMTNQSDQKIIRDFLNYKQRRLESQSSSKLEQHLCQNNNVNSFKRQLSASKCPSCKHQMMIQSQSRGSIKQQGRANDEERFGSAIVCPVHPHGQQQQQQQSDLCINKQPSRHSTAASLMRSRSRSTTRQPTMIATDGETIADTLKTRTRSFSTPASPEQKPTDAICPVHHHYQRQHQHQQKQESSKECDRMEAHHPRCMSQVRKQEELLKRQSTESERPKKPIRGVLRETASNVSVGARAAPPPPPIPVHQSSVTSNQSLHTKRAPKARYMGHLTNQVPKKSFESVEQKLGPHFGKEWSMEKRTENQNANLSFGLGNEAMLAKRNEQKQNELNIKRKQDQLAATRFVNSRSSQRRSTGVDSGNIDDFNSLTYRNATLARAQYANSKNMKEFLSLDAGGIQSTPTQIAALNNRFQKQINKAAECPTTTTVTATITTTTTNTQTDTWKLAKGSATEQELTKKLHSLPKPDINESDEMSSNMAVSGKSKGLKVCLDSGDVGSGEGGGGGEPDSCYVDRKKSPLFVEAGGSNSSEIVFDAISRNVSTTTDDLPLDPQTRKRMFKLTSEEVISERTEPRSLSRPSVEQLQWQQQRIHQQQQQDKSREEILQRQARAVSLGRELAADDEQRGRSARSDAGRRRSLERSMCVDLDPALPANLFKKPYCLSTLRQSVSPIVIESSKSSPSCYGALNIFALQNQEKAMQSLREKQSAVPKKRARTKSSGEAEAEAETEIVADTEFEAQLELELDPDLESDCCLGQKCPNNKMGPSLLVDEQQSFDAYKPEQFCDRMISFKSAPDVSHLCGSARDQIGDELDCSNLTQSNQSVQPAYTRSTQKSSLARNINYAHSQFLTTSDGTKLTTPKAAASAAGVGLSSYAIPLCLEARDLQSCTRQFHSCPNSLRRKPKEPQHHERFHQHQHHHSHQHPHPHPQQWQHSGGYALTSAHHVNECNCQLCLRAHRGLEVEKDFARPSSVYRYMLSNENRALEAECSFCPNQSVHSDADFANYSANFPIAATSAPACSNKSNGQQQHHCQHHRLGYMNNVFSEPRVYDKRFVVTRPDCAHSSPVQYRPCSSLSCRSPLRYGLYESDCEEEPAPADTCHAQLRPACCVAKHEPHFNRSSSVYFRPTSRPVQGYDQTMSRSLLKSRQRAKSQPPADSEATFYLSKSMENVQKLIKEVQNELNSLRRGPLSEMQCLSTTVVEPESKQEKEREEEQKQKQNQERNILRDRRERISEADRVQDAAQARGPSDRASVGVKMSNDEAGQTLHNLQAQDRTTSTYAIRSGPKLSGTSATKRAGQFKCVGAIRKAGFLSVKKWILKRRQSIELARKQGWKRYWVCLRGTALLFHSVIDKKDISPDNAANRTDLVSWIQANCDGQVQIGTNFFQHQDQQQENISQELVSVKNMSQCYIEKEPRHLIIIEGAIAQPIPEHPKRDYVFCLSTTFGDAYLFQSSCQLESDNWISAIHNACAASIARDLTRDEAIKLFETKIRHLELEAEKKLFLRQRLESRLTSMSSMTHLTTTTAPTSVSSSKANLGCLNPSATTNETVAVAQETKARKVTMRSLLYRLNQQLLALDNYIEQVHCEVYQLRCYLSSCGTQHIFYQNIQNQGANSPAFLSIDLPHPKSLLMHVSKPTKLLLIKLGVFTVSSFHAHIHARQGSSDTILQNIQQQQQISQQGTNQESPLELRVRSQSISEALLNKTRNVKLENETEQLIHISNLRAVGVKVDKKLLTRVRQSFEHEGDHLPSADTSDDRYSINDEGNYVMVNLRLHSSSSSMSIIKQVLNIIEPNCCELNFLNYYLRFNAIKPSGKGDSDEEEEEDEKKESLQYVAKRKETLNDWLDIKYFELVEKIIFKVELSRRRIDEEVSPFGISIGAQLFVSKTENLLNVYCSYIEWGSVADKAGLKDDDEFLMINGVPVMDLDMMFIECIIQDETKLKLIVRSSRADIPNNSVLIDKYTWRPYDKDRDSENNDRYYRLPQVDHSNKSATSLHGLATSGSQIISDEYISSLVCPPPPAQSSAFLRTDSTLLIRQKSDISNAKHNKIDPLKDNEDNEDNNKFGLTSSTTIPSLASKQLIISKAKSQQDLNSLSLGNAIIDELNELRQADEDHQSVIEHSVCQRPTSQSKGVVVENDGFGGDLASQLLKKTEQLTQLLGKNPVEESWNHDSDKDILCTIQPNGGRQVGVKLDPNSVERLKKAILELLETEYAYIRHLETISEHYMTPLEEIAYLNIPKLKHLNKIIIDLITFQKDFFDKLTRDISVKCELKLSKVGDDFEGLNKIVEQLDLFKTIEDFKPLLQSLTKTFLSEAGKFKIYAAYCAAYSRLQKLLHPKRSHGSSSLCSHSIVSLPNSLDTFLNSNGLGVSTGAISGGSVSQHRDFLKPLGSFMTNNNEFSNQLRQLSDFLSNLDSSSSSASLSLPKSNSVSDQTHSDKKNRFTTTKGSIVAVPFQKSVHQQNFESYLIKPIQRIVKYPMLLNSITISAQVYAGDDLQNELQTAVKQMESITSHVNDTQRIHDEYGMLFDHIERQFLEQQANCFKTNMPSSIAGPHQPPISLSVEQLLYFGPIDWLNINEFTSKLKKGMNLTQVLFVFTSCVVFICKEQIRSTAKKLTTSGTNLTQVSSQTFKAFQKSNADLNEVIRYQSLIPVSEVQVRSVPVSTSAQSSSKTDHHYQWELFRCSSVNSNSKLLTKSNKRNTGGKVYLLSSSNNETRNAFLRKIRFIIRESVRNMSLPLARSPSSKSLTPKKLSSPLSGTNTNSSCSHSTSLSPNDGQHCKEIKNDVECEFTTGQVDNNYTTSIEVNT